MLNKKSFLITGGTGSFGRTFLHKLLEFDVAKVIVLSRDETKQHELREKIIDKRVEYILGDIRNFETIQRALANIDFVFHAAALKQVPTSESFPWEFVETNVGGSHNLLRALETTKVSKAVFLSTDKAVYPLNAMGLTKALMEKLVRSDTYINSTATMITRYGNVIGSRGSVIPYFIKNIKEGKPISVTDPAMTRFMMSLEESVDLVLHALANGAKGDLFVQKSPAARVDTIVKSLGILMGKADVKVNYVGIRAGEKIHETLLTAEELYFSEESDKYFKVPSIKKKAISSSGYGLEYTSANTQQLSEHELADFLSRIASIRTFL